MSPSQTVIAGDIVYKVLFPINLEISQHPVLVNNRHPFCHRDSGCFVTETPAALSPRLRLLFPFHPCFRPDLSLQYHFAVRNEFMQLDMIQACTVQSGVIMIEPDFIEGMGTVRRIC